MRAVLCKAFGPPNTLVIEDVPSPTPGRGDVVERAHREFVRLELDRAPGRNGVLILIAHLDHEFAIWGDEGIARVTDATRWEPAMRVLLTRFAQRRYADGIAACVDEVGALLARHFPRA